jgi:hypothetical protein
MVAGCLGVLVLGAIIFAVGAVGWAWVIMLIQGAIVSEGEWHMSFAEAIPWGVAVTLFQGMFMRSANG